MENLSAGQSISQLVGDGRLIYMLNSLGEELAGKTVQSALKAAAKPVLNEVYTGYMSIAGRGPKGGKRPNQLFKIGMSRENKPFVAVVAMAGLPRWISTGTSERYTKGLGLPHTYPKKRNYERTQNTSAYRGRITATNYFEAGVKRGENAFFDTLPEILIDTIKKVVEKHTYS